MDAAPINCVLIVEDDSEIREALRDVVEQEGYPAIEAENGRVALDMLNAGKVPEPCLILLDLMMPEMNGWEFMEMRRKSDVIAAIPTVIVSAATGGTLPKGATKILRKPVDLEELIKIVGEYCGQDIGREVKRRAEVIGKTKKVS
jgi:CheY-like chemotaxis protein